jgi:hypothetical protein
MLFTEVRLHLPMMSCGAVDFLCGYQALVKMMTCLIRLVILVSRSHRRQLTRSSMIECMAWRCFFMYSEDNAMKQLSPAERLSLIFSVEELALLTPDEKQLLAYTLDDTSLGYPQDSDEQRQYQVASGRMFSYLTHLYVAGFSSRSLTAVSSNCAGTVWWDEDKSNG